MCETQTALPALRIETGDGLYQSVEPTQTKNILVHISCSTEQILTSPPSELLSPNSHSPDDYPGVNGNWDEPSKCSKYNRCSKSNCIHCATIIQSRKTKEVTKNIKEKKLIRIILTVKSSPDDELKNLTNKLYHCFKQLRRTIYWKKQVKGGLSRLHIDYNNESHSWHPHFDIIAEPTAESDLTEAKLSTLWESITSDSTNLKIQSVTPTELSHIKLSTYILKPSFKSLVDNKNLMNEYSKAVNKKKKLQRFGKWVNTINRKDWIK